MSKMKKTRKPGGGRKKLKPEYDAGKNLKDQMGAAVALYEEDCSLQSIADVLNLNPIKVRKLLITAGVYESEVAEKVQDTFERYRKTQDYKTSILSTATVLGLSKASVTSYLPYKKGVYFQSTEKEKISVGAERQRRYRAVRKLRTEPTEEHLWEVVLLYAGVRLKTYSELVKLRVALYEQYADGNMSKEEFIRQRDAYRVQEDERMEQIQRLRTEKDQIFQPVKKDTDNLQAMMNTVGEAGDVMHLSQNVVEAFIDRIEIFNDERVKIHFTFEDVLADHAE